MTDQKKADPDGRPARLFPTIVLGRSPGSRFRAHRLPMPVTAQWRSGAPGVRCIGCRSLTVAGAAQAWAMTPHLFPV